MSKNPIMKTIYLLILSSLILLNCSSNPDLLITELETANNFDLIVDQVDSDNWRIREAAIIALGHTLDNRAIPYLIVALKDEHPNVRAAAIESLKLYKSKKVVNHIIHCLDDKSPIVRVYAIDALGTLLGKKIAPTIYDIYYNDSSEYVKEWAVYVLKKMKAWRSRTKISKRRSRSRKPGFAKRKKKKKKVTKRKKRKRKKFKPEKKKRKRTSKILPKKKKINRKTSKKKAVKKTKDKNHKTKASTKSNPKAKVNDKKKKLKINDIKK